MLNRVIKSEPPSGWGTSQPACPGCVLAAQHGTQGTTLGHSTPVPSHLPGCPSHNASLCHSQRTDDDDVIFVDTPLQNSTAGGLQVNSSGRTMSSGDDDLVVTFVTLPETAHYPHARGDCKIYTFKQIGVLKHGKGYGKWKSLQSREVDLTTIGPVENNAKYCGKCYCFMCDVPASQCQLWTSPTGAHCNAYKCPSWLAQQTSKPSPLLSRLNLELMTQEVRDAVRKTDDLVKGIQDEYVTFRKGKPCLCQCHQLIPGSSFCDMCKLHHTVEQYDFSVVRQKLFGAVMEAKALSQAGKGDAAMVVLDSLVHVLVLEKSPPTSRPNRNVGYKAWETKFFQARNEIMKEIDDLLISVFVLCKTTVELRKAVIENLTTMLNREGVRLPCAVLVRQWEDRLLSLVLTGANLTGRKNNDILLEYCVVIKRRVERLTRDGNYRQAVRYLKCVNIPAHNLSGVTLEQQRAEFWQLQQQVPLLYAKCGAFSEAFMALSSVPDNAKGMGDSMIAKMDGGIFLELMRHLSTSFSGVKGLPAEKILWACLVALTMNVGVQLNLEFLLWFVQWAVSNTTCTLAQSHDEAACNQARSLILASQKGLLPVSALKDSKIMEKLAVTASESVLYPLFAHKHDVHLDRFVSAFGGKFWAFECSLNSCTSANIFASTHLCQWLRQRYIPQYGITRLRDTTWAHILTNAVQPVAAELIINMINANPSFLPVVVNSVDHYLAKLVTNPVPRGDSKLISVLEYKVLPLAQAIDMTRLIANIARMSFFHNPSEKSVESLRLHYTKDWPKELDAMIRLLPIDKMQVALVSCLATCVKKGEADIVVRMLHANRAGHTASKSTYDFVPTVVVLVEKLADVLVQLDKDTAMHMCDSIKDWLRDESYSPLLCLNCGYNIPLISLNKMWKAVGSICPDRLEQILAHAMKRLGKGVATFHIVRQAQRTSIVSWLKRVATVLKQYNKKVEYQVHLSFFISAISMKKGLVKDIQHCPEIAEDIIPSWMLQEWEGTYVQSMSKWSVQSSGPTKLTFKKTMSSSPVSPVVTSIYSSGSPVEQRHASPLSQPSNAPATVSKAGVTMPIQQSMKESNNNVRTPGNGMPLKNMSEMSLEEILNCSSPLQSNSTSNLMNGEAVQPDLGHGGSTGNIAVASQSPSARFSPSTVSVSASQALNMVANRVEQRGWQMANMPSQPPPLVSSPAGSVQRPSQTASSSAIVSGGVSTILPPPPLVNHSVPTSQVPSLPPHSRPPPPYEGRLRSLQNAGVTSQPSAMQPSSSQNMATPGRPLDRMTNFVNSLAPAANRLGPAWPTRYALDLQCLSANQIQNGLSQLTMQTTGATSTVAGPSVQQQLVDMERQLQMQYSGNVQSPAASTARTLAPEQSPGQFLPTGSAASVAPTAVTSGSFPIDGMAYRAVYGMPVSSTQHSAFQTAPSTSEPVHVFIPNVHQMLGYSRGGPTALIHHQPTVMPQNLQVTQSVSSSLQGTEGQFALGLSVSTGNALGPVPQQAISHVDNMLQPDASSIPHPVQVSLANGVNASLQQEAAETSTGTQDKGPVPVHVAFIPPTCSQEESPAEDDDDYTFDSCIPSPPRYPEIEEIIISDSEDNDEMSGNKTNDDSSNEEVQRQDEIAEKDAASSEQNLVPVCSDTDTCLEAEAKDAQQTSDSEVLLNMSCESIDTDGEESRAIPPPNRKDTMKNAMSMMKLRISIDVGETTASSVTAPSDDVNPKVNATGGDHDPTVTIHTTDVHDNQSSSSSSSVTHDDDANTSVTNRDHSSDQNAEDNAHEEEDTNVPKDSAPDDEMPVSEESPLVDNSGSAAAVENETNDQRDGDSSRQTGTDNGNSCQIEDDCSTIQNQRASEENGPAVSLEKPQSPDDQSVACEVEQTEDIGTVSDNEQRSNGNSQLDTEKTPNTTDEKCTQHVKDFQSKETAYQIDTAVASVVARLVIDVVEEVDKRPSNLEEKDKVTDSVESKITKECTDNGTDTQLSEPAVEDTVNKEETSSATEMATSTNGSRRGEKRKAEAHVSDVAKRTKKTSTDSKDATNNGSKRTGGNAKENRKVPPVEAPKEVRQKKIDKVEQRPKLTRANSDQLTIRATNDNKSKKTLTTTGKTVTPVKKGRLSMKGHPPTTRKDRESVSKDSLVSLEIMTVDASAQDSVTVQELQTVRCNVSFEQLKSDKTPKEKPSSRSMGSRAKALRSVRCVDTGKESSALLRWLGQPVKKNVGPVSSGEKEKNPKTVTKKSILDKSKIPRGIKLPRGLQLKKFPMVRLERMDCDRQPPQAPRKQGLKRTRSQPA